MTIPRCTIVSDYVMLSVVIKNFNFEKKRGKRFSETSRNFVDSSELMISIEGPE